MTGDDALPPLPPKTEERYMIPPAIRPKLARMRIEFLCWGVRNMKSYKLFSVDKPSVLLQVE